MSSTQQLLLGEGAGGGAGAPVYIEDVFSTWLYTGTGAAQTITNGIDLSTKGGLVWFKGRSNAYAHRLFDTARGVGATISSSSTGAQFTDTTMLSAFNTTGFSLGFDSSGGVNDSGTTFASWTFREQPKFFDVVTWTGTGSVQNISHNLGSVPGCIIVKCSSNAGFSWAVYHRSLTATQRMILNDDSASVTNSAYWNDTAPTSTVFTVGTNGNVNQSGNTFVAYLFAHDAGGFGLTGTDNVITCGTFTSNGSGIGTVTLGYEPQWVMIKRTTGTGNWQIYDNMRGMPARYQDTSQVLFPNTNGAEQTTDRMGISATGFDTNVGANEPYIYIAIRRGPMKTPTVGTTVFSPIQATTGTQTTNFPIDLQIATANTTTDNREFSDRLRGFNSPNLTANQPWLASNLTDAEATNASFSRAWNNTGFLVPPYYDGGTAIYWSFRRAPSFFDEVCYTGTGGGATRNVTHNLGVTPELMIVKWRTGDAGEWWYVWTTGFTASEILVLQSTASKQAVGVWGSTPTSTVFSVQGGGVNTSAATYVAYLFATCAGVSKVGSYTGTGALLTVNCGFTSGARFVLIKRTDSTGGWYVYDSVRGLTSGNDPYLFLNDTAVQVDGTNYVDTDTTGFKVTAAAPAGLNASGGTYIFLAIA